MLRGDIRAPGKPCNCRLDVQRVSWCHPDAREHAGIKSQETGSTAVQHGVPAPGLQLLLGREGTRNDLAAHALAGGGVVLAVRGA